MSMTDPSGLEAAGECNRAAGPGDSTYTDNANCGPGAIPTADRPALRWLADLINLFRGGGDNSSAPPIGGGGCGMGCASFTADFSGAGTDSEGAQQQYGRQADGSYKADPAKVKAAIAAGKPIGSGECVGACHALTGVTEHTDSWTPGKSVLNLNDTTDVGLGIASFGSNDKFKQPGGDQNSATYMGHDPKTGQIMVVDQWPPPNAKQYNAPNLHPLANFGPNSNGPSGRIENNAYHYHVIIVP